MTLKPVRRTPELTASMVDPAETPELQAVVARIRACRICAVRRPASRCRMSRGRPVLWPSSTAKMSLPARRQAPRCICPACPSPMRPANRLRLAGVSSEEFYSRRWSRPHPPMGFCFPGQDARNRICRRAANARRPGARRTAGGHAADRAGAGHRHLCAGLAHRLDRPLAHGYGEGLAGVFERGQAPEILPLAPSGCTGWIKRNPWFEMDLLPLLRTEIREQDRCGDAQRNVQATANSEEFRSCIGKQRQ